MAAGSGAGVAVGAGVDVGIGVGVGVGVMVGVAVGSRVATGVFGLGVSAAPGRAICSIQPVTVSRETSANTLSPKGSRAVSDDLPEDLGIR